MIGFINPQNLQRGMRIWQERRWDTDLHERVFRQFRDVQAIDVRVWKQVLNELVAWRAYRPLSSAELYERGLVHLPQVNREYQALLSAHGQRKPDLLEVEWSSLEPFFEACRAIKGVASPVFAAKMSHFLLPACFFVIDNAVIGLNEPYHQYWQRLRRAWQDTPDKTGIIDHFHATAPLQDPDRYPYATKITEICLMGVTNSVVEKPTSTQQQDSAADNRVVSDQSDRPIRVGDVLISNMKGYHHVVISVIGLTARILWLERVTGEPMAFYTYTRDVNVYSAPGYYRIIPREQVDKSRYRSPRRGWPW